MRGHVMTTHLVSDSVLLLSGQIGALSGSYIPYVITRLWVAAFSHVSDDQS